MSQHFGAGALRLFALSAHLLGWRPEHFWNATPAELAAVLAPLAAQGASGALSRSEFNQMMERDHA